MVGSSFKGNIENVKLMTDDFYFILERRFSKSEDGSEVWLALDEGLLQARLKSSQHSRENLLQHYRFIMKFTPNLAQQLTYHHNEYHILETIQLRSSGSKSLPSVHCAVAAETCTTPMRNEQTGEIEREAIANKAFIVLPYIAGETLTTLAKDWGQSARFDNTHALVPRIERAFEELSSVQVVHRDISPNNVMQDPHGGIHLIDFGFASDLQADTPTRLGEGTVKYRAPEVIDGTEADSRADQYSLACVFYFLLTGRSPSHGPSVELVEEFKENLPSTLSEVLTQAISTDKDGRYSDFRAFFSALKHAFTQDIQARDELRPLQKNIDNWFEHQTVVKQIIEDYQQLQITLQAPSKQLKALKTAGLIGEDKLNTLLSYENIEASISSQIAILNQADAAADKHIKPLKRTLNRLKQGENTTVPSLTNPSPVKLSQYTDIASEVQDELDTFNDFLAGIAEHMVMHVEQHGQWPHAKLKAALEELESITSKLNQQKDQLTKQFSNAKKANEVQNSVLTQLNQFISELNQASVQAQTQLTPSNSLVTDKAHLIASITERLQSATRIETLLTEYHQFIEKCQGFNHIAEQAKSTLALLKDNQQSTTQYWQKAWNEASESKVLSTSLLLILLVSIIAGVVYWSPFKQKGESEIFLTQSRSGVIQLPLTEEAPKGAYSLNIQNDAVKCQYNTYRSSATTTYFICKGTKQGKHAYTLTASNNQIVKTGFITVTPPVHAFKVSTTPPDAKVSLVTASNATEKERFNINDDVPEGDYELTVSAANYHSKTQTITWRGQQLSIKLEAVDNEPPSIEFTNIKQVGETLSLTINAKDNKGLKQLIVKMMQGGKEIEGSENEWKLDSKKTGSIGWKYNLAGLGENSYQIVFQVIDTSGMVKELVHEFGVDFYTIAKQFYDGKEVKQDYNKAIEYFKVASEAGSASAQINLGFMYWKGQGVEQDYKKAVALYEQAANQGNASAQYNLGYMYENGDGVEQNIHKALELYRQAAKSGLKGAKAKILELEGKVTASKVKPHQDKTYTVGNTNFTIKAIPAGSFMMGSESGDDDEKPVHRVNIKAFSMMQTEVTWAMYQPCIDAGVCPNNDSNGGDNGWGKGNRPVINVSWDDITKHYIPWLNKQTGQTFKLPSEAEWEYAARAGSTTKYSWGDDIDCSKARYGYYSDECGIQKSTDPVKSFQVNAFGLYDMHGNVWESTQDCWHGNYDNAPTNGSAWMSDNNGNCGKRVLRGGSWNNEPAILRSANRFNIARTFRSSHSGFRLVQKVDVKSNPIAKLENQTNLISNRYFDNKDGTVTDIKTNLQWTRCAFGESWEDGRCMGKGKKVSLNEAIVLADNSDYANYKDWRVPNHNELSTLVKCNDIWIYDLNQVASKGCSYVFEYFVEDKFQEKLSTPTIDSRAFPNTGKAPFWLNDSNPSIPIYKNNVHTINFINGAFEIGFWNYRFRLVRGIKLTNNLISD